MGFHVDLLLPRCIGLILAHDKLISDVIYEVRQVSALVFRLFFLFLLLVFQVTFLFRCRSLASARSLSAKHKLRLHAEAMELDRILVYPNTFEPRSTDRWCRHIGR